MSPRGRSSTRARAGSISNPDKKEVLTSLLDLFLETHAQEDADKDIEDGSPQLSEKLLKDIESFLSQVALCYQSYGCPTHTIELNMVKVAKGLGINAQFLVFPSHLFVEIGDVKTAQGVITRHNQFFRTSFGYNFYKLQLVDELVRRISSYAQEAEDVVAVQALDDTQVDEAFSRARAYSVAMSGGAGDIPMPNAAALASHDSDDHTYDSEAEEEEHDLPVMYNGVISPISGSGSGPRLASGSGSSSGGKSPKAARSKKGYMTPVNEDEKEDEDDMTESLTGTPPAPMLRQLAQAFSMTLSQRFSLSPSPSAHSSAPTSGFNSPAANSDKNDKKEKKEGKSSKKLAHMILSLARLGPNVYGGEGVKDTHTERTYRTLFSKLAVEDGVKLIRAIIKQKPLYSIWFKVLMVGTSSFGACGLFYGGSWSDCALSLALGVLIAIIELFSLVSPTFSRIYEFVATFVASIIIRAINAQQPDVCYRAVLLGTVVFALQGVTITLSFVDLMTKDLITGTTRLFFGMLVSALIGFAMDISTSTYASIASRSYESVVADSNCVNPISTAWYPLMFIIMTMSFNVLLEAHTNQLFQMLFITACSYLVYYYVSQYITNQVPVILASFVASVLANLYSRRTAQPAVVYILPAIFLLVPGSVAASSFYTVLLLDLNGGLDLTFAVVTGALSVAIGIFGASALVPVPDVEEFFRKANAAYPTLNPRGDSPDVVNPNVDKRTMKKTHRNSGLAF